MNLGVKKKNTNQKSHILRAFAVAGAPLFFSLLIQAVLVIELYRNTYNKHVDQTDEPRIVYLQIACLLLWFIDMSADLSLMTRNAMVICAKRYEVDDDIKTIQIPCFFRAMILSLTVLTEFLVWLATIISGSLFLLKAQSAEDLILNAVAVNFVTQLDEILLTAFINKASRERLNKYLFEARWGIEEGDTQMKNASAASKRGELIREWLPLILTILAAGAVAGAQVWGRIFREEDVCEVDMDTLEETCESGCRWVFPNL